MASKIQQFFRKNPIFTYQDFTDALYGINSYNPNTVKTVLRQHEKQGHIVRIRRQLFASIPVGANSKTYPINPFLLSGKVTEDAILAYHTALAFYQMTYSSSYRFVFLSEHQIRPFQFRTENYERLKFPSSLLHKQNKEIFVNNGDVQGLQIKVTSLERTLVDVLDRPLLGGGWEEVFRSLSMIKRLKINNVIDYALMLNNSTTIAKTGFYLSQRQDEFHIDSRQLNRLRNKRPSATHYIDQMSKKDGCFIKEWNIIVPRALIEHSWEEIDGSAL